MVRLSPPSAVGATTDVHMDRAAFFSRNQLELEARPAVNQRPRNCRRSPLPSRPGPSLADRPPGSLVSSPPPPPPRWRPAALLAAPTRGRRVPPPRSPAGPSQSVELAAEGARGPFRRGWGERRRLPSRARPPRRRSGKGRGVGREDQTPCVPAQPLSVRARRRLCVCRARTRAHSVFCGRPVRHGRASPPPPLHRLCARTPALSPSGRSCPRSCPRIRPGTQGWHVCPFPLGVRGPEG